MTDFYLRFVDEQQFLNVAQTCGFLGLDGLPIYGSADYCLDVIGNISEVSGFLVNLRVMSGVLPDNLSNFLITPEPNSPVRGFL
jgi:hypothetical protein